MLSECKTSSPEIRGQFSLFEPRLGSEYASQRKENAFGGGVVVILLLQLHLRVFDDTKYRAKHADAKTPEPCDDVDVSDGEEDGEEDGETEQAEAAVAAFS